MSGEVDDDEDDEDGAGAVDGEDAAGVDGEGAVTGADVEETEGAVAGTDDEEPDDEVAGVDDEDEESDTHSAIMGATYHALCKHGYAHLTMQDIADEFDKSRPLLHYHYDTKEELMLAFVDNMIGWIANELAESETEEPLAQLQEYVDRFVIDPGEEDRRTFALALLELRVQAVHNEEFRDKLAAHYQRNIDTVAAIIEEGIDAGVFLDVDPDETGEAIYTALVGARMYQVTMGAEHASRRMRDILTAYVVHDLLIDGREPAPYSGKSF